MDILIFPMGALSIDIADKLIPNLLTMLAQLASTGVIFLVFKKYLYAPVMAYIEKRNQSEQDRLTQAQESLEKAKELEYKRQLQFQDASNRVNEMIETGRQEALRIKETLIEEGQQEAQSLKDRVSRDLDAQMRQAQNQLRQETIAIAMMASEKLLKEKVDELSDKKRIEEFVSELSQ